MRRTSETRVVLIEAIRRALAGHEHAAPLDTLPGNWKALDQMEKSALLQLYNWADDYRLRRQFAPHAEYSQRRMQDLLEALESE